MTTDATCPPHRPVQPPVPPKVTTPFYYSSLSNVVVHYLVKKERVLPFFQGKFKDSGLEPADFDGMASVSYNFQVYTGFFSTGLNVPPEKWNSSATNPTQELELNIVAFPQGRERDVPEITFNQWLMGDDQTKLLGNHRIAVPCDNPLAISVGEEFFAEPKFETTFQVNLPSPNPCRAPGVEYEPEWVQTWGFRVNDPDDPSEFIFTAIVDTTGLTPVPAAISSITEYGIPNNRGTGCRWNILHPYDTFFLAEAEADERVKLIYGSSTDQMGADMRALLGGAKAYAVQTYLSAPVAFQSRPYYLHPYSPSIPPASTGSEVA
jgi:hypothetical protein